MSEEWSLETERAAYTARAQAVVEALADYEATHPPGTPCLHEALRVALAVMEL